MTESADHGVVVRLTGDVDMAMIAALRYEVSEAIDAAGPAGRVTVDLDGVDFVDSMALGALVELKARAEHEGVQLVLASPSSRVRRIVRIAGLAGVLGLDG